MILKYTPYGMFSQVVIANVTRISVDYEPHEPENGSPDHNALVQVITNDGETQTIVAKPDFVFLMNDQGKTIDRY